MGSEIGDGVAVATGGAVDPTGDAVVDGVFDALGLTTCAEDEHATASITMMTNATDRRYIFFMINANGAGRHPI